MKKIFSILLCFSVVFCIFSGCNSNKVIKIPGAPYRVDVIDGEYYLVMEEESLPEISDSEIYDYPRKQKPRLDFESTDQFVKTFTTYRFDSEQLKIMQELKSKRGVSDENGLKLLKPEKIYLPNFPEEVQYDAISWYGDSFYLYNLKWTTDNSYSGYLNLHTEESFKEYFDLHYEGHSRFIASKDEEVEFHEVDNDIMYYYSSEAGDFKRIRYSFTDDGIHYMIDESYCLTEIPLLGNKPSADIPDTVDIYATGDDLFYTVWLSNLKERPTKEFLSQFKLKPYSK